MNYNECENIISGLINKYGIKDDLFIKRSYRISRSTYKNFIEWINYFYDDNDFIASTAKLIMWAHYTDLSLDIKDESIWQMPYYMWASFDLFQEYTAWVKHKKSEYEELFSSLFKEQMQYQVMEKQWEIPAKYLSNYGISNRYFEKTVILLFPFLTQDLASNLKIAKEDMVEIIKIYFTLLLLFDDLQDIQNDISEQTLTFPIAKFYMLNNTLPDVNCNFGETTVVVFKEIDLLLSKLRFLCSRNNIPDNIIIDMIEALFNKMH